MTPELDNAFNTLKKAINENMNDDYNEIIECHLWLWGAVSRDIIFCPHSFINENNIIALSNKSLETVPKDHEKYPKIKEYNDEIIILIDRVRAEKKRYKELITKVA